MPKRTNAFQELAAIIHSKLSPGWVVRESMLLRDVITGDLREVDIVARATVANYDLCISIECRDHRRVADVTWIESMAKKHESLATSKLVLWSRSGFTKTALIKATILKIETVSQASAINVDWAKLARGLAGGYLQLVTSKFSPFIDVQGKDDNVFRLENVDVLLIYDARGIAISSIQSFLQCTANSKWIENAFLDHAPIGCGSFYLECRPPEPWFVEAPDGGRVSILRIGIGISTVGEKLNLDTASAIYNERVSTLATAKAAAGRFQLYVEEAADGSRPIRDVLFRKLT